MNGAGEVNASNANGSRELKVLGGFAALFVFLFFLPVGVPRFDNALKEGLELGTARAVGAVAFSVLVGLAMHFVFRREEQAKAEAAAAMPEPEVRRPLWQNVLFFAAMVGVLVFANGSKPAEATGLWAAIYAWKWPLSAVFAAGLGVSLGLWFGFSWRGLALATTLVAILSFIFAQQPLIPFIVGCAGLAVLYVSLVIVMATVTGLVFGALF